MLFFNNFTFVIDTNSLACRFDRQLCAFITGTVGECCIGQKEAEEFHDQMPDNLRNAFVQSVVQIADDKGCYRPCSIWDTPGLFNNGTGELFRNDDSNIAEQAWRTWCLGRDIQPPPMLKQPAFLSVAIFFRSCPTQEMIRSMKDRAKQFAQREHFHISDFRLLQRSPGGTIEQIDTRGLP